MVLAIVKTNKWTVRCRRCREPLAPGEGDLHHPPGAQPFYLCPRCTLVEGVPESKAVERVLAGFPRPDPFNTSVMLRPYPYQADDARRIATMRALLIGSQMGTGKTICSSLGALRADCPNLIFCPASVKWNWLRELQRWRSDLTGSVAAKRSMWQVPAPGHVTIASWGLLPGAPCKECRERGWSACPHKDKQPNPLPELTGPVVLMADEIQYLQNTSERQRLWDLLRDRVWETGGYLFGLTGTVVSNKPGDLKALLERLHLYRPAFKNDENFRDIFEEWLSRAKGDRSAPTGWRREALLELLRPVRICRLRKHVLKHLPPVQEKVIQVELTKETIAEVDEAVQKLLAVRRAWQDVGQNVISDPWAKEKGADGKRHALGEDEKTRRLGLWEERVKFYYDTRPWVTDEELKSAITEAVQSKHELPAMTELSRIRALLSLAKVKTVLELVEKHEAEEEPLLIFCQHITVLEKVAGGRAGWGLYHGGISQKARDELVQAFQRGEIPHGVAISITAGGEGINLTRAGAVCFIDQHWNPAKNDQAAARVLRPGAEIHDSITIWRLLADHAVDRLLWTTIKEKVGLHEALEDNEASMAGLEMGAA